MVISQDPREDWVLWQIVIRPTGDSVQLLIILQIKNRFSKIKLVEMTMYLHQVIKIGYFSLNPALS